jgi:nucleotide-binding universal stress UspA family protein
MKESEMSREVYQVLIATDGSEGAMEAVRFAASLLASLKPMVTLLHVIPTTTMPMGTTSLGPEDQVNIEKAMWEGGQVILDNAIDSLQSAGIQAEGRLSRGEAADEILKIAREEGFGLIVLSSHGEGGTAEKDIGGTSEAVVRNAPCPVLIVRQ